MIIQYHYGIVVHVWPFESASYIPTASGFGFGLISISTKRPQIDRCPAKGVVYYDCALYLAWHQTLIGFTYWYHLQMDQRWTSIWFTLSKWKVKILSRACMFFLPVGILLVKNETHKNTIKYIFIKHIF